MYLTKNSYIKLLVITILVFGITYQVNLNSDDLTRLEYWSNNLRCPVCQGEVLSESPSSFADDMELLIEEQIKSNWTDAEISEYWTERYGDEIIMNPQRNNKVLYLIPISLSILFSYIFLRKTLIQT
ncbi:MAG: cytochrome c-type biogenesis protein CcmH [Actinomycetota bacterium]|nr:cytochrome c-type biogenesis protein CcmH [Actinomycetota bacterium]